MTEPNDAGDSARERTDAPDREKSTERLKPAAARIYEDKNVRSFEPAVLKTSTGKYSIDHLEHRENVVRAVNFDDANGGVFEVVEFPYHQVEYVERYSAEKPDEYSRIDPEKEGSADV